MCLYPKLIKNRKYVANKKNGGVIPAVSDNRTLLVPVGCGKCIECRKQYSRSWQVRLLEEVRENKNGKMVTLTFSTESLIELEKEISKKIKIEGYERDNQICTLAVRRFLERWRKKHKKSVKHWLITELGHGKTEHVHIHGIIWTNEKNEEIQKHWKYGNATIGNGKINFVNEQTVNYITKYVTKTDDKHEEYKPIILTSKGIGKGYIEREKNKHKYKKNKTDEAYRNRQGYKMNMPIYYRNKIYSEEEKEKLWIEKLDKKERYILGEKIDISKNEDLYFKILEIARKKKQTTWIWR